MNGAASASMSDTSALLLWREIAERSPDLRITIHTPYAWERRWLGHAGYMERADAEAGDILFRAEEPGLFRFRIRIAVLS